MALSFAPLSFSVVGKEEYTAGLARGSATRRRRLSTGGGMTHQELRPNFDLSPNKNLSNCPLNLSVCLGVPKSSRSRRTKDLRDVRLLVGSGERRTTPAYIRRRWKTRAWGACRFRYRQRGHHIPWKSRLLRSLKLRHRQQQWTWRVPYRLFQGIFPLPPRHPRLPHPFKHQMQSQSLDLK